VFGAEPINPYYRSDKAFLPSESASWIFAAKFSSNAKTAVEHLLVSIDMTTLVVLSSHQSTVSSCCIDYLKITILITPTAAFSPQHHIFGQCNILLYNIVVLAVACHLPGRPL